jgi:hypothetical protein
VTPIQKFVLGFAGIAAAANLAGCATPSSPWLFHPVPGSVAEQLWFDKATGDDINTVPPLARFHGLRGYPHTDRRGVRILPPPPDEP